jgi:hypothetical protein
MDHLEESWADRLSEALLATALTLVVVALVIGVLVLCGLAIRRLVVGRRKW